ncbi:MAG TPA: CBS domain-containing protein [Candidatus Acidoferrales bacterium]|nr:CBS domain-containing protein [Candidatus Acidoferrales bacterium]
MLSNKVREIMSKDLVPVSATEPILQAMRLMVERDVGRVLITENESPVGIFTETDVLRRVVSKGLDSSRTPVKKVMTAPIQTVPEDTHIVEALGRMYRAKFRHLAVVDSSGTIVGIASMRGILKLAVELGRGLPETRTVGSIMSRRVVTVAASVPIAEVIALMVKKNAVAVVVLSRGAVAGIFTERDVLTRVAVRSVDARRTPVRAVMTEKPVTASSKALVGEVLEKMYEGDFRNMPILGEKGELIGIVSMADVLKFARALDIDESVRKSWREIEEFWQSDDQYTPG